MEACLVFSRASAFAYVCTFLSYWRQLHSSAVIMALFSNVRTWHLQKPALESCFCPGYSSKRLCWISLKLLARTPPRLQWCCGPSWGLAGYLLAHNWRQQLSLAQLLLRTLSLLNNLNNLNLAQLFLNLLKLFTLLKYLPGLTL